MALDDFAPFIPINGCFVVKNIAPSKKTIFIFNFPVPFGMERDLLRIRGISETDIRSSTFKGEIQHKILAGEIEIICSDIDLLQFNQAQKQFLQNAGIVNGLTVGQEQATYLHREDIQLDGNVDDVNNIFTIPNGETFIQNSLYKIVVYKNGVKQWGGGDALENDYLISESGGVGTGYDTVIFTLPPQTTPSPPDIITADYYVVNV